MCFLKTWQCLSVFLPVPEYIPGETGKCISLASTDLKKKITRNYFDTGTGSLRIRIWSLLVKRPLGHFFLKLPSKVIALQLLEGWCYSLFDGLEKFCKCGQQNCWLWSRHVNHSLLSTKKMSVSLNILAIQTH